jgi:hypothetical protein
MLQAARTPDVEYYFDFILSKAPAQCVETIFSQIAGASPSARGALLKSYASLYADASELPPDVWLRLGEEEPDVDDNADAYTPDKLTESDDELMTVDDDDREVPEGSFGWKSPTRRTGMGLELWSPPMLSRARPIHAQEIVHEIPSPNMITIRSLSDFSEGHASQRLEIIPRMTVEAITAFVAKIPRPRAVVIDPPLDTSDALTIDELTSIFRLFSEMSEEGNVFIFVWVDPWNLSIIRKASLRSQLEWCDSICAELVSETTQPISITSDSTQTSRMIVLLRTVRELKRGSFAQQRSLDAGIGIARRNGKSRGRFGMPQIPHAVAESFWPGQTHSTVFLELWPTRMSPRRNWIMLDEEC